MIKAALLSISIGFVLLLTSCNAISRNKKQDELPYKNVSFYYGDQERDTLLVDLVTYIGRKPSQATVISRFDPEFREYYINLAKNFIIYYYHVGGDVHTFYLSRPARSLEGNRRGVLGSFKRNSDGKIVAFREILNTVVGDEDRIRQLGETLMSAYLLKQDFESLMLNQSLVEWPDSLLRYDTTVFEWRYVEYTLQ